jgi:hypothetical protein
MNPLLIFLLQLILLFFLSLKFQKRLHILFYLLFRHNSFAAYLSAIIFLPGTIIHELAHFLIATVLFVRTGDFDLLPKKSDEGQLKLGSVKIAQTDFIRRNLIGFAPLFIGILAIFLSASFLPTELFQNISAWPHLLLLFLIIIISSTMYPSKKDLDHILPFIIVLTLIIVIFYYFSIKLPNSFISWINQTTSKLNPVLTLTLLINLSVILLLKVLSFIYQKVFKIKLIHKSTI